MQYRLMPENPIYVGLIDLEPEQVRIGFRGRPDGVHLLPVQLDACRQSGADDENDAQDGEHADAFSAK